MRREDGWQKDAENPAGFSTFIFSDIDFHSEETKEEAADLLNKVSVIVGF